MKTKHMHYTNVDILRILASFMVILIHVAAGEWYTTDVASGEWAAMNFYDSAARSGVPIFFMISGMLFLSRDKCDAISKLLKNNILKLVVVYIVWATMYAIDTVGIHSLLASRKAWVELIKSIIAGKYQLWFLPAMIGAYLLIPILFSLKEYKKGKYIFYTLVLFFVFGILFSTVRSAFPNQKLLIVVIDKVKYELVGYSGYFLLGYYLFKKNIPKMKKPIIMAVFGVIVTVSTVIGRRVSMSAGEPKTTLYGYMTLPIFLEAILLFLLFIKWDIQVSAKTSKMISLISKCTLGIFLVHPFVIEHLDQWFGFSVLSFTAWFSVPIICVLVFVISTLVVMGLLKIPVVNKWLI